jgi:hypothetical protein
MIGIHNCNKLIVIGISLVIIVGIHFALEEGGFRLKYRPAMRLHARNVTIEAIPATIRFIQLERD